MPNALPSRLIGELTFPEISKLLSESSILCLPIGSIEQHGPHLPLNTDVVLAEAFTQLIIARWGEPLDLWQLPTLATSLAREHEWAPGTMSLSIQGMTAFMRDLGREIARALPARNLVVVNGHGGNRGILEAHRNGIVSSTTLLANGAAFAAAVAAARETPGLGIGVHLNLSEGPPVSPATSIPSLLDAQGRLHWTPERLWSATFTPWASTSTCGAVKAMSIR